MVLQRKDDALQNRGRQLSSEITYAVLNSHQNHDTQNNQPKLSTTKQPQKQYSSSSRLDNVFIFGIVLFGGIVVFSGFVALLVNVII
ncbi:MAG: hypothetical protein LBD75_01570 [Candidatus Peribacteria bacterium]|jgi:hypothetical protein|nr:hypothetical protein [Candidatus Peribacteria bacterium]